MRRCNSDGCNSYVALALGDDFLGGSSVGGGRPLIGQRVSSYLTHLFIQVWGCMSSGVWTDFRPREVLKGFLAA